MFSDVRRAAAGVAVVFFGCNVYTESLLTGPKGGDAGTTSGNGGSSASGGDGASGGGGNSGGRSGDGGSNGGAGTAGKGSGATSGSSGASGTGATSGTGGDGATGGSSSGGDAGDSGGGGMADGGDAGAGDGGTGGNGGAGGNGATGGGGTGGAGTGGDAAGGTSGSGGAGTGGGGSGGDGAGGTGGTGGTGGLEPCPSGCARLAMDAFESTTEKAHYVVSFANTLSLQNTTVTFRIFKQAGGNGLFTGYIQNGPPNFEFSTIGSQSLNTLTDWQSITFNVNDEMGGATAGSVRRVGIEIAAGTTSGSWAPMVIYVDSITLTPAAGNSPWNFNSSSSVSETGSTTDQTAGVLWLNNGTSDTTVSGATLTWYDG